MHKNEFDRPEAQNAWKAFESSGKVADYLSYTRAQTVSAEEREELEPPPEDGRDADKNQGPGPQTTEYR